ncbi:MAG: hypothetical protein JXA71_07475, partial [Chitinispirillaceae bacterium]|nr:hypothetical protein [Chitinispirillaceae bacterium]
MNYCSSILIAACFCTFIGCISSQEITRTFQDPSYSAGQLNRNVTVRVLVAENLDLRDFVNSFEKEYHSEQIFIAGVSRQIVDSMQSVLGTAAVVSDNQQEAAILSEAGVDETAVNKIHSLLASLSEDFFCIVNTVTIANRRVTTAPMAMTGPAGNTMPGGSSETA